MDHIRQFDWYDSEEEVYFVKEEDLDNCVTERILRNQFRHPMAVSESEDEIPTIDWDAIFSEARKRDIKHRNFVPGVRPLPPYPKVSALTGLQHYQGLKVLCAQNPHILDAEFLPRPTKQDYRVFEEAQVAYAKEQKEFIEWAKTLWVTGHCIRALRPKPPVETTYDAEFEMKAKEMQSFHKSYTMAAQIPLENKKEQFKMTFEKELIGVEISTLPKINNPEPMKKQLSIMQPRSVPDPCTKHPCRFILPSESTTTILPLTEVHRELAQYALDNGAEFIAREKALKCLVEVDRAWTICLSVCEAYTPEGDRRKVLVLGGEVMLRKECAQIRTHRAFNHLLQYSLVPDAEKSKFLYKCNHIPEGSCASAMAMQPPKEIEDSSDDDGYNLFIASDQSQIDSNSDTEQRQPNELDSVRSKVKAKTQKVTKAMEKKKDEFYKCTCEDTLFELPPPRSFTKWCFKNSETHESYDVIVHCSHKVKGENGEVLLEPVPEYQLDLGASKISDEKIKSLALSLYLRKNATAMTVRVDGSTGEVVRSDSMNLDQLSLEHGDLVPDIAHTLSTALGQLQHLMPGHYLLHHEVSHGRNALLYAAAFGGDGELSLDFVGAPLGELDEAADLKIAPILEPLLLPWHKLRKILPLAFTPFENQLSKEAKKPPARQRAPPNAIAWPKKKAKRKGKRRH